MRWIFFSLVVTNLVAFAWGMVKEGERVPQENVSSNVGNPYLAYPQLQLISEKARDNPRSNSQLIEKNDQVVLVPTLKPLPEKQKRPVNSLSFTKPDKKLCELVGPFESKAIADDFIERLSAIEVKSDLKELELPAGPGYWVYLEPRGTRREAFRLLKELQAKKIDSYVIPKGDLANGISLGMFSKKSLADARMKEMTSIGLEPQLEEIERTYRELWVMLNAGEGLKMSDLSWERAKEGINLLQRRQNYCLSVASE